MAQNNLDILTSMIMEIPLWIQEVVYIDLKKNLEQKVQGITSPNKESEIYYIFVPELTFKGKQEVKTHEHKHEFNIYKYLNSAAQGMRVVDITLNNLWSLEESSKYLVECIKNEYIKNPQDAVLNSSIYYLAGEIRLGEYVKRLNKINAEELDVVLRKQKMHNEQNENTKLKIGEIMINMGYIAHNDIDKILFTKDEAKRRFLVDIAQLAQKQTGGTTPSPLPAAANQPDTQELLQKIQKLTAENNLLKDKLRAIFNIQNKHKPQ